MPRGRGELAVLLYFPTLMGAFFSLGTPQAITALISKGAEHTEEVLTTGFRLAVAQVLLAVPLFILCAPLTLTGDNRQLAVPVEISCACGAFMILVPYFNAMAYGLKRFTWVNAVTLAGQVGYVLALLILWFSGTLTPLAAALSALGSQLLQCLLHLIHIKPRLLNKRASARSLLSVSRAGDSLRSAEPRGCCSAQRRSCDPHSHHDSGADWLLCYRLRGNNANHD